jgi:predicted nucleotidyltransferase
VPLSPGQLLDRLPADLTAALGPELSALYVHGSWAVGDFHPGRSDLDFMAVLANDPTEATLATLDRVHAELVNDHPEWRDHVEVDYVSPDAVRDALEGKGGRVMVRISPGEPIHLTPATSHYLLNWHSAERSGQVLFGIPPNRILPEISSDAVRRTVLDHLRQWPGWVEEMRSPGVQAYAVLTVCRAAAALDSGHQVSKRAAAAYGIEHLPQCAPLIEWARDWWYAGGRDDESDRFSEVAGFVREVTPRLLAAHA